MSYLVTTDRARIDVDRIHAMLRTAYWSKGIRRDVVERALANSVVAVAIDESSGLIVGVARVVTDHATFAWLCDVFVDPSHRGCGLSSMMLRLLEEQPGLETLRRWCLATRDAHGLYAKFGYEPVDPDRWMQKQCPPEAWREPGGEESGASGSA
ncbi:MAG: GNAT family N-acetyltransferase [Phycisphaerales bacterium]